MTIVVPGNFVVEKTNRIAKEGTYVREGGIFASVVGQTAVYQEIEQLQELESLHSSSSTIPASSSSSETASNLKTVIRVNRSRKPTAVPEIDSIITGRVIRINQTSATLSILVVGSTPCTEPFQGIIRMQDVRATERDKIILYDCFRPGDIVRAQVVSLGDARSYYLSTSQNELGVILASSAAGHTMIPISWEQMICPKTRVIERRKCAKPN